MKISCFGSRVSCSFRKALRAAATSGRSCSAACTLFLKVRLMWWRNREIPDWLAAGLEVVFAPGRGPGEDLDLRGVCFQASYFIRLDCRPHTADRPLFHGAPRRHD